MRRVLAMAAVALAAWAARPLCAGEAPTTPEDALRDDVATVCRDVVTFFRTRLGPDPAYPYPLYAMQAPDGNPRLSILADKGQPGAPAMQVAYLTCLDTRNYCQIAYQLAHELGHAWTGPEEGDWRCEAVCSALALECLSWMAERWKAQPPHESWRDYAPAFEAYRQNEEAMALARVRLEGREAAREWVLEKLPTVLRISRPTRPEQTVIALAVAELMHEHPDDWGDLRWRRPGAPEAAPGPLARALDALFDMEVTVTWRAEAPGEARVEGTRCPAAEATAQVEAVLLRPGRVYNGLVLDRGGSGEPPEALLRALRRVARERRLIFTVRTSEADVQGREGLRPSAPPEAAPEGALMLWRAPAEDGSANRAQ